MSSKITQEKYDLVKIEKLKHYLESASEKGKPKFYEIFVDNLKAVEKTSDPESFDEYLVYMGEDTRMVKVLIYTSTETCPRNDKFIFIVTNPDKEKEERRRQELSGIEIEEKIQAVVQQEKEKMNIELLKREVERLEGELDDSEKYIEELEKKLEETKQEKVTSKGNLGEIVSMAFESMLRRNTHLLGGIPLVGEGLAGLVEQDNRRLHDPNASSTQAPDKSKAGFEKVNEGDKSATGYQVSKEDQEMLGYFNSLRQAFTQKELLQVFEIIGMLSYSKDDITHVLGYLKGEGPEEEKTDPNTEKI